MITKKYLVLSTDNEETLKGRFTHYEAIVRIEKLQDAANVWKCNKTPIMIRNVCMSEVGKIGMEGIPAELTSFVDTVEVAEIPSNLSIFPEEQDKFIKFCHSIGIECGEYSSGVKYNTADDDCFLCRIGNYGGSMQTLALYNKNVCKDADVIIYESKHFYVVSEFGAIVKGFLMICPKEHILSQANLPEGYFNEYYQVERDVEYILKHTFGDKPVAFFEHGSDPSGKSSHKRSVVHAHTHVVWGFGFQEKFIKMVSLKPFGNLADAKHGKYFSYRNGVDGELMLVNDPAVYVQRQFPRQVIAEQEGLAPEQYNWRKQEFRENITATLYNIFMFLDENYDSLPKRIKERTNGFVKGYRMRRENMG